MPTMGAMPNRTGERSRRTAGIRIARIVRIVRATAATAATVRRTGLANGDLTTAAATMVRLETKTSKTQTKTKTKTSKTKTSKTKTLSSVAPPLTGSDPTGSAATTDRTLLHQENRDNRWRQAVVTSNRGLASNSAPATTRAPKAPSRGKTAVRSREPTAETPATSKGAGRSLARSRRGARGRIALRPATTKGKGKDSHAREGRSPSPARSRRLPVAQARSAKTMPSRPTVRMTARRWIGSSSTSAVSRSAEKPARR